MAEERAHITACTTPDDTSQLEEKMADAMRRYRELMDSLQLKDEEGSSSSASSSFSFTPAILSRPSSPSVSPRSDHLIESQDEDDEQESAPDGDEEQNEKDDEDQDDDHPDATSKRRYPHKNSTSKRKRSNYNYNVDDRKAWRKRQVGSDGLTDDERWAQRMAELEAYHRKHGNVNVPQKYKDNQKLANWLKNVRQRWTHVPNYLTPEKESILFDLGVRKCEPLEAIVARAKSERPQQTNEGEERKRKHSSSTSPPSSPESSPSLSMHPLASSSSSHEDEDEGDSEDEIRESTKRRKTAARRTRRQSRHIAGEDDDQEREEEEGSAVEIGGDRAPPVTGPRRSRRRRSPCSPSWN